MKKEAFRHPKIFDLAARLGVGRPEALGLLQLLIDFTEDSAIQGNVGKWTNGAIARACDWTGDPDEFIDAFVNAGWLDACPVNRLIVHDWEEHCQTWVRAKIGKMKLVFVKPVDTIEATIERTVVATIEATPSPTSRAPVPNLVEPNLVEPNRTDVAADASVATEEPADEFVAVWNSAKGNKKADKWTDSRKRAFNTRLKDPYWRDHWREAIAKFPLKVTAHDPDGWKPDVDWFLKPDSVTKILEGKYDWSKSNGKRNEQPGVNYDPSAADATF